MNDRPKTLGVALVGLGSYSTQHLAPAFEHSNYCNLAGIVTGTPVKASMWSRKYDISKKNTYNYGNFERIIDSEDIDIVYVVLPNALHAEYVIKAAQAKKHIICQKPMAVSSNECSEMIAACKENGVKLSIDYRLHFDPFHQYLMSVDEPIREISGAFEFELKDHSQWRQEKRLSGGGALMDLGIYCVQAGCYLLDSQPEFVTAQSRSGRLLASQSMGESIQFQMHFKNSATTSFSSSYNAASNELNVHTSTDKYQLRKAFALEGLVLESQEKGFVNINPINQQAKLMDAFAESILNDTPIKVSGEMGKRDLQIIEAIYAATRKQTEVRVEY